ncbi:MAG: N-acetyltransferase [bacterium]
MNTNMNPENMSKYLDIAERTGAFKPRELNTLRETLIDCSNNKGREYLLVEEYRGGNPAGFSIFGELEWTDFSWEMYWLIVDPNFHGQGIGKKLLEYVEKIILKESPHAVLIAETSSIKSYDSARLYYQKTGFTEVGRVPNYYDYDDDLVTFYKIIDRKNCTKSFEKTSEIISNI